MKKYLVYLTKSREVAERLSVSFKVGEEKVEGLSSGMVNSENEIIPSVYLGRNYFYCIVTYAENASVEPYRLVIA